MSTLHPVVESFMWFAPPPSTRVSEPEPQDLEDYAKAMVRGDHAKCVQIEEKHDLFGYSPELVSVGLRAIAEGKDAHAAIERHIRAAAELGRRS